MPLQGVGQTYVDIEFNLAVPDDARLIGVEALALASTIHHLMADEDVRRTVVRVVRAGFDDNFRTESAAGDPWKELAKETKDDREHLLALGFDPERLKPLVSGFGIEHPILQRTGDYRESWASVDSPWAFEELRNVSGGTASIESSYGGDALSALGLEASPIYMSGDFQIAVGSADPRVPKLEGGEPDGTGIEYVQETLGGETVRIGAVPPRPVRMIPTRFTALLDDTISYLLRRAASR